MKSKMIIPIKPRSGKRAKAGHCWIFSNEIQHPDPQPEPGTITAVEDTGGHFIGYATYNPHSLIALRILSRDPDEFPGSVEWFEGKIRQALQLRERLYPSRQSYRLIYADSDGLPGVIVDKYGHILAVQVLTAGMGKLIPHFVEALKQALSPTAIVFRNNNDKRKLEGLPLYTKVVHGTAPERCEIEENGVRLLVDAVSGQKTGHFFDQADNRQALSSIVTGGDVLDLFCYTGAWALKMLTSGAKHAVALDSSEPAIRLARQNAELNNMSERMEYVQENAFTWLSEARRQNRRFDAVVVDPPAFAQSAKQAKKALRGYEDLNRQAIHLIRDGGILCTCSCSYFVGEEQFLNALYNAASRERRRLQILQIRGQAADHPVLISMPETRYLKCVIGVVGPM